MINKRYFSKFGAFLCKEWRNCDMLIYRRGTTGIIFCYQTDGPMQGRAYS